MKPKPLLLFVLGIFCCLSIHAETIFYVKSGGSGDGSSWNLPLGNIQTAIDGAQSGDQIWVAKGSYSGLGANGWEFILKDGVSLYGGFSGTESSIDQRDINSNATILAGGYSSNNDNTLSGTDISSATVINGFTLAPNNINAYSRGLYLGNSSPVIKNCIITGNKSFIATSSHNGYGAAVYLEDNSQPAFINCTFSNNKAIDYGGGIYSLNSAPSFTNCRFLNNDAGAGGGGAFNNGSSALYVNCIFQGNTSESGSTGRGGGIGFTNGGESKMESCLITANKASAITGGAGVYCNESGLSVINCTITGNIAENQTGGGGILYSALISHAPIISNSIIWNNISDHADASLELYEITGLNGSPEPAGGNNLIKYGQYGNIGEDPLFMDPTAGNYQLQSMSPAIDAGENTPIMPIGDKVDLAGHPRVINDIVDLGAFETITNKITNNGDASFDGFAGTLNITGNKYDNDLVNTYKWKMIVSSPTVNEILVVDPNDLIDYKSLMDNVGIVFDSTHFMVNDLSLMPTLLQIITQTTGWETFNGEIIISRVVYPSQVSADSLLSNSETIRIASTLPVEVNDFRGSIAKGEALLQWHTGVTTGFDHFEVEKSLNGQLFTLAATIRVNGGTNHYSARIMQSESTAYYRLKMVNKDGSVSYYQQVLTLAQDVSGSIEVYPNPASTSIHIKAESAQILHLYDLSGKRVLSVTLKQGLNRVYIGGLSSGIYFGRLTNENRSSFRFIKK